MGVSKPNGSPALPPLWCSLGSHRLISGGRGGGKRAQSDPVSLKTGTGQGRDRSQMETRTVDTSGSARMVPTDAQRRYLGTL